MDPRQEQSSIVHTAVHDEQGQGLQGRRRDRVEPWGVPPSPQGLRAKAQPRGRFSTSDSAQQEQSQQAAQDPRHNEFRGPGRHGILLHTSGHPSHLHSTQMKEEAMPAVTTGLQDIHNNRHLIRLAEAMSPFQQQDPGQPLQETPPRAQEQFPCLLPPLAANMDFNMQLPDDLVLPDVEDVAASLQLLDGADPSAGGAEADAGLLSEMVLVSNPGGQEFDRTQPLGYQVLGQGLSAGRGESPTTRVQRQTVATHADGGAALPAQSEAAHESSEFMRPQEQLQVQLPLHSISQELLAGIPGEPGDFQGSTSQPGIPGPVDIHSDPATWQAFPSHWEPLVFNEGELKRQEELDERARDTPAVATLSRDPGPQSSRSLPFFRETTPSRSSAEKASSEGAVTQASMPEMPLVDAGQAPWRLLAGPSSSSGVAPQEGAPNPRQYRWTDSRARATRRGGRREGSVQVLPTEQTSSILQAAGDFSGRPQRRTHSHEPRTHHLSLPTETSRPSMPWSTADVGLQDARVGVSGRDSPLSLRGDDSQLSWSAQEASPRSIHGVQGSGGSTRRGKRRAKGGTGEEGGSVTREGDERGQGQAQGRGGSEGVTGGSTSHSSEEEEGRGDSDEGARPGPNSRKISQEKVRRHRLSQGIKRLKSLIGSEGNKVGVVEDAFDYIKLLQAKSSSLEKRVTFLESQLLYSQPP